MKYRIFVLLLGLALLCGCAASPTEPSALREPEPTPETETITAPDAEAEAEPAPEAETEAEPEATAEDSAPEPEPEPLAADGSTRPAAERVDFAAALAQPDLTQADGDPLCMAHNIYSDPDLSGTSGQFSGFLIDFRAEEAGTATYWALCTWAMNTDSIPGTVLDNGGAYAGLQMRPDGPKSIIAFWEIAWQDASGQDQLLTAVQRYPEVPTNHFDGEGEGSNYITDYSWQPGSWYRMYLCCYEDEASGHTFVELWFRALPDRSWEKSCCFDTGLSGSCFEGGMTQFMENYDSDYAAERRSFEYCNLYVREYSSGEWIPVTSSLLNIDTWWGNKKGTFAFGAEEHTLWGITQGYGPDIAPLNADYTASYPLTPYAAPDTP